MREIKFRGKTKKGVWIYGSLGMQKFYFRDRQIDEQFVLFNDVSIFCTDNFSYVVADYSVLKDTVCQFIGRLDKNGTEIYEGDIITVNGKYPKLVKYDDIEKSFSLANISELKDEKWINIWQHPDNRWWTDFKRGIEVIGNIYDNPELFDDI